MKLTHASETENKIQSWKLVERSTREKRQGMDRINITNIDGLLFFSSRFRDFSRQNDLLDPFKNKTKKIIWFNVFS